MSIASRLKPGVQGPNPAISSKKMIRHIPPVFNTARPALPNKLVKGTIGKSALARKGPYAGGK